MTFEEQYALANDPVFQQRVTIALVKSAVAVMAEPPATEAHADRAAYAGKVLGTPEIEGMNMALGVVTNPAITVDSPDDAIEFTVNSMWNAYAGVIPPA
jgi:hypothetical protein